MYQLSKLQKLSLKAKRVLVRSDLNVPLNSEGQITDDSRIQAAIPTIQYIIDQGGSVVLMSHLGRPKKGVDPKLSLKVCAKRLSELLNRPVMMAEECVGEAIEKKVKELKPGDILLLENLRFHEGEEYPEKEPEFVKQLAKLGDLYVNDAFGTAHRAHASTALIADAFKGRSGAGLLLQKELEYLEQVLKQPKHPFYTLLGGAKLSTKLGVIGALLKQVDKLLIGGAMAYTFLKAQGFSVGASLVEETYLDQAKTLLNEDKKSRKILLPVDHIAALATDEKQVITVSTQEGIPEGYRGVDIGPETIKEYSKILQGAKTIFWNGPMGIFETPQFAKGTFSMVEALAESQAVTVVGGGESVASVIASGKADRISHLSTGGGATLEYLEQGTLPGIEVLKGVVK